MTNNYLYKPSDLAKRCDVNKSTLQGYLRDIEVFAPVDYSSAGHRLYDAKTIKKLNLFLSLKKKPFRVTEREIKTIFKGKRLSCN